MIKWIPFVLWLSIAVSSVGCSGLSKIDLGTLMTSGRDGWQHPELVIESLGISRGDHVAEIGAGSGYWLRWLSEAVGPEGRVYAVEVEQDLVVKLQEIVADEELGNVEVLLGGYDDPRLPDGEIDLAMTCLTYHHIEDRGRYFEALQADLTADGRVAHLDDRPDSPAPISWFQGDGHWTDPLLIVSEMENAGYVSTQSFDFLPAQSFQVFEMESSVPVAGLALNPLEVVR